MKVGGHSFQDHLRLLSPLFGLVTAVWVLRLVLAAAGAPKGVTSFFSLTAATPISVLLAVLLIHMRRFGSYPNVVLAGILLNTWAELLIIAAIVFSVLTGTENIFTAPEYSFPEDNVYHLRHIYGHLTFGIGVSSLLGAGVGCLLLWLLRKMVPVRPRTTDWTADLKKDNR